MDRYIDLHMHSDYSDGTDSPAGLVLKAKELGLCAVALTDHDTTAGLDEFIECGREQGIETVCGIEISTQMGDIEAHILGYYIDYRSGMIEEFLAGQEISRLEKLDKTLAKLREIGFQLSKDDFCKSKGIVTRGSIAAVMHEKGYVSSKREAFSKYIGEGQPAFVDRERIPATDAVRLILECGGMPVLAHPYLYDIDDTVLGYDVGKLAAAGLAGIEVLYPVRYSERREMFCRSLAEKHGLLITGGSDYHGENKTVELGRVHDRGMVPYRLLEEMKKRRGLQN